MAAVHGTHPQLLRSVMDINAGQRLRTVQKVREALGGLDRRRIAILGASFKADTDDTRNSPALELASLLHLEGASVVVYDPVVLAERITEAVPEAAVARSVMSAVQDADAVIVATEWQEFADIDLGALGDVVAQRLIIDARNLLDPVAVRSAGFEYHCLGRPASEGGPVLPSVAKAFAVAGGAS
ncbi:MAG: UDP binding domain-containing protein [Dehalococcoidia bacterium]